MDMATGQIRRAKERSYILIYQLWQQKEEAPLVMLDVLQALQKARIRVRTW